MSDLDRVIGKLRETTTTGDVAPVLVGGAWPANRRRALRKSRNWIPSVVSSVTGKVSESDEDEHSASQEDQNEGGRGVIPDDAQELDDGLFDPSGLNLKEPKFVKKSPDRPRDDDEKLLTPKAALVAPDVTPDSMTELDPSDVPGRSSGGVFTASDAVEQQPRAQAGREDTFTGAMDTLLGRQRPVQSPAPQNRAVPSFESIPAVTPDAAAALFSSGIGDPLREGQPMPDHKVGDGKKMLESFRRFFG